jgi:hypothetical protein
VTIWPSHYIHQIWIVWMGRQQIKIGEFYCLWYDVLMYSMLHCSNFSLFLYIIHNYWRHSICMSLNFNVVSHFPSSYFSVRPNDFGIWSLQMLLCHVILLFVLYMCGYNIWTVQTILQRCLEASRIPWWHLLMRGTRYAILLLQATWKALIYL